MGRHRFFIAMLMASMAATAISGCQGPHRPGSFSAVSSGPNSIAQLQQPRGSMVVRASDAILEDSDGNLASDANLGDFDGD